MATTSPVRKKTRLYEFDWLRVFAFGLLIVFHISKLFTSTTWLITNPEKSQLLKIVFLFISQWRLPLLFLISGIGIRFALGYRSKRQFVTERTKRLLIPLFFGVIVFIPPQQYLSDLHYGIIYDSYFQFLSGYIHDYFFNPEKGLYFRTQHLWFLVYLFVFTMVSLPFFFYTRTPKGKKFIRTITIVVSKQPILLKIFLTAIPLILIDGFLRFGLSSYISYDHLKNGVNYILFLYGFMLFSSNYFMHKIDNNKVLALIGGIMASALFLLLKRFHLSSEMELLASVIVKNINLMFWLVIIVAYAKTYLSFNSKVIKYANEAVYPFYIFHQNILVLAGFYIIPLSLNLYVKFTLITILTFGVSFLIYEYIIRRINFLRPFFGMKKLKPTSSKPGTTKQLTPA